MHCKLVMTLAITTAATVPGFASATGMFCQPGEDWTTVDSGTITGEGWSVVNFTKPEGGQMKITWTYEDFDDGPATAGMWFGFDPEQMNAGASLFTNDQSSGLDARVHALGADQEERTTFRLDRSATSYAGQAELVLGSSLDDPNLHLVQYAAGQDTDGWNLTWKIERGNCLDAEPSTGIARGDNPDLLTQEDLHSTLAAEGSLGGSAAAGPDGARAIVDGQATRSVSGVPFVNVYWYNRAGEIRLNGPDEVVLEDAKCYDWSWYTDCLAWGDWADPGVRFGPGDYTMEITGFTDPSQEPTGPTRGPYMLFVPTALPDHGGEVSG